MPVCSSGCFQMRRGGWGLCKLITKPILQNTGSCGVAVTQQPCALPADTAKKEARAVREEERLGCITDSAQRQGLVRQAALSSWKAYRCVADRCTIGSGSTSGSHRLLICIHWAKTVSARPQHLDDLCTSPPGSGWSVHCSGCSMA